MISISTAGKVISLGDINRIDIDRVGNRLHVRFLRDTTETFLLDTKYSPDVCNACIENSEDYLTGVKSKWYIEVKLDD